jgi:hypothetical protein
VNAAAAGECEVFYWRERSVEVDFIVRCGHTLTALEVKSGRAPTARSGLQTWPWRIPDYAVTRDPTTGQVLNITSVYDVMGRYFLIRLTKKFY